mmetsp:Transcript_50789/g.117943  ORF Transcript_50789/g.117943 Transcript_50789/m.117943 type:complete len:366 (-) Transcript_50789:381-1478(-)
MQDDPAKARVKIRPRSRPVCRSEYQRGLFGMVWGHTKQLRPLHDAVWHADLTRMAAADTQPLAKHEQLASEARVGVADGTGLAELLMSCLKGQALPPHEVGYGHRRGPAHPFAAMHQDPAAAGHCALHPVQRPVEERRDVLAVGVLEIVREVAEVLWEAAVTHISCHVHNVCDPVPLETLQVPCYLVTSEVDRVRDDLGAGLSVLLQLQGLVEVVGQVIVVLLIVGIVRTNHVLLRHIDLLEVQHRWGLEPLCYGYPLPAYCHWRQVQHWYGAPVLRAWLPPAFFPSCAPWHRGFSSATASAPARREARHSGPPSEPLADAIVQGPTISCVVVGTLTPVHVHGDLLRGSDPHCQPRHIGRCSCSR